MPASLMWRCRHEMKKQGKFERGHARECAHTGRGGEEDQMSRFLTSSALSSMNLRRDSTSSPISVVKIVSVSAMSSSFTCSKVRRSGSGGGARGGGGGGAPGPGGRGAAES